MSADVPTLPYLAPWYRVACAERKVVLEHGQRLVCLEGGAAERLVPALLPLLDGHRTVDEIARVLGEAARPAVEHVLAELAAHGVLEQGPAVSEELPRSVAGTAELLASLRPGAHSLAVSANAVTACSVAVAGEGAAGVEAARLLRAGGADVRRGEAVETGVDLTICAPSGAELSRLSAWNDQALEARAPWLQVLPFDGRYASVGPLYLPADTCCYECFRLRRLASLGDRDEFELFDDVPGRYPSGPALDALVAGVASLLALAWLVHGDHYAPGSFYAVELVPTIAVSVHHVYRVPRCPACSEVAAIAPPLPWHKEMPVARGG